MEQLPTLEHITPEKLKENDSQQENNELSAEQKKFQERYERELKPLIEILKPDHVSFEDFEEYTLDTLYESVGKIQSG